jgi:hypothetical protein
MIHKHAKKTPTASRRRLPTNAIKAVNVKARLRKANRVAATAASVSTPMRPYGFLPFVHSTVAASPEPSALLISSLI